MSDELERSTAQRHMLEALEIFGKAVRNAALDEAAMLIRKLHAEPHCVNGHDRCYEGPDDSCPYCEKRSDLEDAILALKDPKP